MTRETRFALLFGLGLIVAFALALTEIKRTWSPPAGGAAVAGEFTVHSLAPAIGDVWDSGIPAGRPKAVPGGAARRSTAVAVASGVDRRAFRRAERFRLSRAPGRTYIVRPNDSLTKIARCVYGDHNAHLYKRIFEANRDILPDEATLGVGQVLVLPPVPGPHRDLSGQALRSEANQISRRHAVGGGSG